MLTIKEHKSASYSPRTYHNAAQADLTIAIACDFTTGGEKLTKTVAGLKYLPIPLELDPLQAARLLYRKLPQGGGSVINVAGNGIYTLSRHGWSQERANAHVFAILSKVHAYLSIKQIVTGGQTGIDLAGATAGVALEIDTVVTMPHGYLQRHEDRKDHAHTKSEIMQQIQAAARLLQPI